MVLIDIELYVEVYLISLEVLVANEFMDMFLRRNMLLVYSMCFCIVFQIMNVPTQCLSTLSRSISVV